MIGKIEIYHDIVAEKLDELADLSEYWKKNRDKGLMPNGIRAGMVTLAEEVNMIVKTQNQQLLNKN